MGSLFIPSLHLTESEVYSIGGDFLLAIFLSIPSSTPFPY